MKDKLKHLIDIGNDLKILYVEDDQSVRESTLELLQKVFSDISVAVDGKDGLNKFLDYSDKQFDLILTDINMPNMNGLDMVGEIRNQGFQTSVLILSAHNDGNYFMDSIKHGVDGYLIKPLDMKQFIDVILTSVEKIVLQKKGSDYKKTLEEKVADRTSKIEHQLYHDDLTSLKNRTALRNDLESSSFSSLLLIDIDKFYNVNEIFGLDGGNIVLTQFSSFLTQFVENKDYEVYRIGSDDFVLRSTKEYLDLGEYEKEIPEFVEEVSKFSAYIEEADDYVELDVTIGISFEKINSLEKAEIALKFAKKNKRSFIAYNRTLDTTNQLKDARYWRSEIKKAILEDNIIPFFQPIVDRNQNIIKCEALMRLKKGKNDDIEYVSPFFFLDVAKQTKQYTQLTEIMIEKSFEAMKDLNIDFSLNLSFEDITNRALAAKIKKLINRYDNGKRLIFEIVESEDINDYEEVSYFVEEVKQLGVRIAIDDFGSGFSNYKRIFDISPSFLKIDGSLIKNIDTDKNSFELVKSIVSLTKALDIETIGEFVYSKEIFDICYELGIDSFQGYYFSEPLTSEALIENFSKA